MADAKISELTELASADSADVLAIVDTSAGETKKIQFQNLGGSSNWTSAGDILTTAGGEGGIKVTPMAAPSHAEGTLYYDSTRKCFTAYNAESDVSLQVGEEVWKRVTNVTGTTITNGSLVYINGESSGVPTIALANADSLATSQGTIGFATHDIETATQGYITFSGTVRDLATDSYSAGDPIYLATTGGAFTDTKPDSPAYVVRLGVIGTSHATTGTIEAAIDIGDNTQGTIDLYNGAILEDRTVDVSSNGTIVTCTIEKTGGGDLSVFFNGAFTTLDCTPAASVNLTAGTDIAPTMNYIYVLQSTGVLTVSTSGFPSAQHAPVGTVFCQSAASVQTDEVYKYHEWTDHLKNSYNQGHLADLNHWIRHQHATYMNGITPTFSGSGTGTIELTNTSGTALQLHDHTFPAMATAADIYVINHPTTAYLKVSNIADINVDSTGSTLNGRICGLVFFAVVSEDDDQCKWFCVLPSGSYNGTDPDRVRDDREAYQNYGIDINFRGCGVLVHRLVRSANAGGTTITLYSDISDDLRGVNPSTSAGGGGGSVASLWQENATGIEYTAGRVDMGASALVGSSINAGWNSSDNWLHIDDDYSVTGKHSTYGSNAVILKGSYQDGTSVKSVGGAGTYALTQYKSGVSCQWDFFNASSVGGVLSSANNSFVISNSDSKITWTGDIDLSAGKSYMVDGSALVSGLWSTDGTILSPLGSETTVEIDAGIFGSAGTSASSAITCNGENNQWTAVFRNLETLSYGVRIQAGVDSSSQILLLQTKSGTNAMKVRGDGIIEMNNYLSKPDSPSTSGNGTGSFYPMNDNAYFQNDSGDDWQLNLWERSGTLDIAYSAGKTMIGDATPVRTLHIHDDVPAIKITSDATGATVNDGFEIRYFSSQAQLINFEATPMAFYTSVSTTQYERLTIASDGEITMGTTASPTVYADTLGATNKPLGIDSDGKLAPLTSGSFEVTLTGCTTSPTGTAYWQKSGNFVTLCLPSIAGTSNSTTCTITGVPSDIHKSGGSSNIVVADNGIDHSGWITYSNSTLIVKVLGTGGSSTDWTASGDKQVAQQVVTYRLD
jgi:hypothetical protein